MRWEDHQGRAIGQIDGNLRAILNDDLFSAVVNTPGEGGVVLSVAFSPNGRQIASGGEDRTVWVWDLADPAAEPLVLYDYSSAVLSVAFSPDGRQIASGAFQVVRLWDLADPAAEPLVLSGHADLITSVTFSPDGRQIASASFDETVRVWPPTEDLLAIGCQEVWRNLTWEEWQRYLALDDEYRCTCPNLPPHPSVQEAGAPIAADSCPLSGQ